MEVFLNLFWAALVATMCICACQDSLRAKNVHRSWLIAFVAVILISTLIFPAISLSDDLSIDPVTTTEASMGRMSKASDDRTHPIPVIVASLLFIALFEAAVRRSSFKVHQPDALLPLAGFQKATLGRAPPQLSF
jgi:predicted neutral ceramidase superfamily lipid hydrolase